MAFRTTTRSPWLDFRVGAFPDRLLGGVRRERRIEGATLFARRRDDGGNLADLYHRMAIILGPVTESTWLQGSISEMIDIRATTRRPPRLDVRLSVDDPFADRAKVIEFRGNDQFGPE